MNGPVRGERAGGGLVMARPEAFADGTKGTLFAGSVEDTSMILKVEPSRALAYLKATALPEVSLMSLQAFSICAFTTAGIATYSRSSAILSPFL